MRTAAVRLASPLGSAAASARASVAAAQALPLGAAAGGAATLPRGVTLPSPTLSGPLNLPNVWKRRPGNRGTLLYERTMREMLSNLRYLCAAPNRPGHPRPEPVHRMLRRVATADDLAVALKGLGYLRDAHAVFTEQTAAHLIDAAFTAGQPGLALDVLSAQGEYRNHRVPMKRSATLRLLRLAVRDEQPSVVSRLVSLMWSTGHKPDRETAAGLVHAWAGLGQLEKATRMYARMRVEGWGGDHRPLVDVLRLAVANSGRLTAPELAALRAGVIPDAQALGASSPVVVGLLAELLPKLPPLAAAEPALAAPGEPAAGPAAATAPATSSTVA